MLARISTSRGKIRSNDSIGYEEFRNVLQIINSANPAPLSLERQLALNKVCSRIQ